MPKDDYDVIVFKILLYYYGCLKRKVTFDTAAFNHATDRDSIDESYFTDVIVMMSEDGLLDNVSYTTAWGNERLLTGNLSDVRITSSGVKYLKENSKMQKAKDFFTKNVTPITSLIKLVFDII